MTYAAVIFGFIMAFGIGANDVANAFATSVSAKSLTLKQAVLIAAICEFLGAMLLGASVTSTIRKSIIDGDMYTEEPDVLMFGMLTALVSASFMMAVANHFALPISTTHTIIGSIVGFSIAAKGFESVIWKTVALIFVSWAAAPLITGIFGAIFFFLIRRFVLRSDSPYKRAVAIYPMTIFLAVGLDLFMVFYKAGKNNAQIKEWGLKFQIPMAWGISGVLAVIFYFALQPFLERRIAAKFDKEDDDVEAKGDADAPDKEGTNTSGTGLDKTEPASTRDSSDEDNVCDGKDEENASAEDDKAEDAEPAKENKKSIRRMASQSLKKLGDATINRDIEAEGER